MALRPCPECDRSISTAAASCPHCGYPIKKERPRTIIQERSKDESSVSSTLINIVLILVIVVIVMSFC
ncbi:hypothetical protein FLK61_25530 [Paenalkalicoccus suaedae]|uniref:UPF0547 domain-containing protein n=1 Tax=Paenalkalicoccus suaedae TaxID=2592382 RepID=A0A859FD05_9BACI|nr:zinc ribbon domain-containing protein [Paenalkalicoccus suaedae]QKS70135.1 hypothetical protein FLK61_25530 [Paenalkalicoccus suaedae]